MGEKAPSPGRKAKGYAVEVNEVVVFAASAAGSDWWLFFRRCQRSSSERLAVVKEGWPGDLVRSRRATAKRTRACSPT